MTSRIAQRREPPGETGNRAILAVSAAAGIASPVALAVHAVHGLLRPEFSFVADPLIELVEGPSGWLGGATSVLQGLLLALFAVGLHLGVRRTRWGALGPALLGLAGLVVATLPVTYGVPVMGPVISVAVTVGLILVSRRLARDPRWRGLSGFALGTGIVLVIVVIAGVLFTARPGAPLQEWIGLLPLAINIAWLACTVALALRLWTRATSAMSAGSAT